MGYSEQTTATLSNVLSTQDFLADVLMNALKIVEDDSTATAATDGKTIWLGPWFRELGDRERVFVLCHEIMHVIFQHMPRAKIWQSLGAGPDGKPFNHPRYNAAGDFIINDSLIEAKIGTMPEGGLHDQSIGTFNDHIDDVYRRLPEGEDPPEGFDEHRESPDSPESAEARQADMERILKAAAERAVANKKAGELPGYIQRIVGELLNPTLPWQDLLRRQLSARSKSGEADWSRPNRRKLAFSAATGITVALEASRKSDICGAVVVQIDVSGSIGDEEAASFLNEVRGIVDDCHPSELYILWTDAEVSHVDHMDDDVPGGLATVIERVGKAGAPGGGGTDMREGFAYVEKWGIEPDAMVTFTDGYTPWPDSAPPYWHLTVLTNDYGKDKAKAMGPVVLLK